MHWQTSARAEQRHTTTLTTTDQHFSRIADTYRHFRTTDSEPITSIAKELKNLTRIEAIDIGCGTGRYDILLHKYLGDKLHLTCVDANVDMLAQLDKYLKKLSISNCVSLYSKAENLAFQSNSFDCIFTFNAMHHFNLSEFLQESARILKSGGYLFIYTRLHEQNGRNIWGRYFPKFQQKETRLYTLSTMTQKVAAIPTLRIRSTEYFKYRRMLPLEQLVERVKAHHYSTFSLYSPEELEESITGFVDNIETEFNGVHWIRWFDEMTLFTIQKI